MKLDIEAVAVDEFMLGPPNELAGVTWRMLIRAADGAKELTPWLWIDAANAEQLGQALIDHARRNGPDRHRRS